MSPLATRLYFWDDTVTDMPLAWRGRATRMINSGVSTYNPTRTDSNSQPPPDLHKHAPIRPEIAIPTRCRPYSARGLPQDATSCRTLGDTTLEPMGVCR